MLRLQSYELDTNFSRKYIQKATVREVQYSDKNIIPRVEKVFFNCRWNMERFLSSEKFLTF